MNNPMPRLRLTSKIVKISAIVLSIICFQSLNAWTPTDKELLFAAVNDLDTAEVERILDIIIETEGKGNSLDFLLLSTDEDEDPENPWSLLWHVYGNTSSYKTDSDKANRKTIIKLILRSATKDAATKLRAEIQKLEKIFGPIYCLWTYDDKDSLFAAVSEPDPIEVKRILSEIIANGGIGDSLDMILLSTDEDIDPRNPWSLLEHAYGNVQAKQTKRRMVARNEIVNLILKSATKRAAEELRTNIQQLEEKFSSHDR